MRAHPACPHAGARRRPRRARPAEVQTPRPGRRGPSRSRARTDWSPGRTLDAVVRLRVRPIAADRRRAASGGDARPGREPACRARTRRTHRARRAASGFTVRAPDGRVVARVQLEISVEPPQIAWSPDGRRLALVRTATSRTRTNWWSSTPTPALSCCATRDVDGLTPQAFSPDGSALLVSARRRVQRLVLGGGGDDPASRVGSRPSTRRAAVAITSGRRILIGGTAVRVAAERLGAPLWGADGMLAYVVSGAPEGCAYPSEGCGLLAGGRTRTLVEPAGRELRLALWSPDGRRLAVDLGPRPRRTGAGSAGRGRSGVARDYAMFSARGDAAMRRIALRAARALRRGDPRDGRAAARAARLRRGRERYDEAAAQRRWRRSSNELDRWLIAAGWRPHDASTRSAAEVVGGQLPGVRPRPVRFAAPARAAKASASSIS